MSPARLIFGLSLSLLALLSGCGAPRTVVAESTSAPVSNVPRSRQVDDTARFLAGMPGNPGSPFAALEQTGAWREHRRELDAAWQLTDAELLAGFRKFQAAELSGPAFQSRTVFYPFSGPDTLTVT